MRRTCTGNSLTGLFASIDAAVAVGVRLSVRPDLVWAAVCVARDYRGLGLLAQIYARMRADLATRYDCPITDIARENGRSLATHRRAAFEVCGSHRHYEQTWGLVICDWART